MRRDARRIVLARFSTLKPEALRAVISFLLCMDEKRMMTDMRSGGRKHAHGHIRHLVSKIEQDRFPRNARIDEVVYLLQKSTVRKRKRKTASQKRSSLKNSRKR
jgi:hypothetical protein